MVWMIAGVLVMSDAIGRSGVGDMIGNGLLVLLGDKPSGVFVLFVFAVTSIVMTTFMSNTGTAAVLTPIAASLSMVAGMDPRGIVLIINIASIMAIAFPSGSAAVSYTHLDVYKRQAESSASFCLRLRLHVLPVGFWKLGIT